MIAASCVVLAVSAVLASARGQASYTRVEVVRAFAGSGFALTEVLPPMESPDYTGYGPTAEQVPGSFFFPKPDGGGPFYVLVAYNDLLARRFFAPYARVGQGDGALYLLQGNVVLSSDGSTTATALTSDERRRIRAAMRALDEGGQAST